MRRARIRPAGWLPDGSALVVTLGGATRRFPSVSYPPPAARSRRCGRSAAGRVHTRRLPSVSPDGRLIAFAEGSPGDIHVISRDGRTAHRITDHPADDHRPLWSPDGRHLAFLSTRNGSAALWTVAIRDGQPACRAGARQGRDAGRQSSGLDDTRPRVLRVHADR